MSERCLVSFRKNVTSQDSFYDCIYDENATIKTLLRDWLGMKENSDLYFGPWKLNIRDKELFHKFMEDFSQIKNYCSKFKSLDDCWSIYVDGVSVYDNPPAWFSEIVKLIMSKENNQSDIIKENT
jgi:hypothetical protein